MANGENQVDNILFIVEGVKSEAQYIQAIYQHYYGTKMKIINRSRLKANYSTTNYRMILDINWIENANIEKFVKTIKDDEFGEAISIVNYFKDKNDVSNYSEAFIIIDADLKDKSSGEDDANEKITLIKELNEIVQASDDNVELLISSPQIEAVADDAIDYKYKSGESYKKLINGKYSSGVLGELKANTNIWMLNSLQEYINDKVDYYDQSMYPIETFDQEKNIIKVRSPLFHLIATKQGIYDNNELLINFLAEY